MKFLPPPNPETYIRHYSGQPQLEDYIDDTKQLIVDNLPSLCHMDNMNLTRPQQTAIKKLQRARQTVTIKPADKNLGIVLMNTDDYIQQCMIHLTNTDTYRLATDYPTDQIHRQLSHTLVSFKLQLESHSKPLYKYLSEKPRHSCIPRFYGIPKIHKKYTHLPPLRPIVSQTLSILSPSAQFIDHVLQPLACSYPDYLHNSTALSLTLQDLHVPDNALLVSIDVESLYPSIPQSQCLHTIYQEMHNHTHLLTFDPNLIIQLLHTNINYNYFSFDHLVFQQVKGTAMGAVFSPTIANIFMSTILRDFLHTQSIKPLLITRYIDDIFMIWTGSALELTSFLTNLNTFHPNLHFTHQHSSSTIDFLDLTIYKSTTFHFTNILDTKTFQKPLNLYQYPHFSSHHPHKIYKAIIKGECIRYIRTNTTYETYAATVQILKLRLRKRNYPKSFIDKATATVNYNDRHKHLQRKQAQQPTVTPPLYKFLPPPQYKLLKQLVLQNYTKLHFTSPRFISLRHPTLQNMLVRAQLTLTADQFVDVSMALDTITPTTHIKTATLPHLRLSTATITACNQPRCVTCRFHLNCSPYFKSNHPRYRTTYHVRHSLSCTSTNIIYLITCTKCKKQYVGCTSKQLNTRINHHRTSIHKNATTFIHKHFTLADHSITHLSVQPIDMSTNTENTLQDLHNLEHYWIRTLHTLNPYGLNSSPGN